MDAEALRSQIAYLDDSQQYPFQQSGYEMAGVAVHSDLAVLIRAMIQHELSKMIQHELSKGGHPAAQGIELSYRVALLERNFERSRMPVVQYVRVLPKTDTSPMVNNKFPKAMIVFYSLGLATSLIFATLITLSTFGTNLIHPFLSLLGLVGGIGWLTTAWIDLLLWKREKLFDPTHKTINTAIARIAA